VPGVLNHSPADVLRTVLIALGLGTSPDAGGSWPMFVAEEPNTPDNVITVFDAVGRQQGRTQFDGEVQEHHGFQVRVRARDHVTGYTRARLIATTMDTTLYQNMAAVGANSYLHSASRNGDVIPLGKEPNTKRKLFIINAVASLRQLA